MRKKTLRTLSVFLTALMLCLTAFPAAAAESATAATMQLVKTEGAVDVTNGSGRSLTKRDDMRLHNGYHVKTGAASYAWVDLDSTKLTKLDAVSEVEVRRSGKKLELLLSSGNLFFNVTSPLEEGETLNVRTATMVVGIRGTSGWLKINDRWSTEISVLEGTVQCNVTDPVTGQVKTASVQGGEKAIATVYPQDQGGDKCDIIQERLEPGDISGFVLEELARDPALCAGIYESSGLDVMDALETARERLEQDQQEMQEVLDRIGDQQTEQDNNVSTGPVWGQDGPASDTPDNSTATDGNSGGGSGDSDSGDSDSGDSDSGSGGSDSGGSDSGSGDSDSGDSDSGGGNSGGGDNGGGDNGGGDNGGGDNGGGDNGGGDSGDGDNGDGDNGDGDNGDGDNGDGDNSGDSGSGDSGSSGGDVTDPPADPAQGAILTFEDLKRALEDGGTDEVILSAGDGSDLKITIPREEGLTLPDGIDVTVQSNVFLIVEGKMTGRDNNTLKILDGGAVEVVSSGILEMQSIESQGFFTNDKNGNIKTERLTTSGTFGSAGNMEGTIAQTGGHASITGGRVDGGSGPAVVMTGGTFAIDAGEVISSGAVTVDRTGGGSLTLDGGTITNDKEDGGYALALSDEAFDALDISGGTVLRAKTEDIIGVGPNAGSLEPKPPVGYTATGAYNDGYYRLVRDTGS